VGNAVANVAMNGEKVTSYGSSFVDAKTGILASGFIKFAILILLQPRLLPPILQWAGSLFYQKLKTHCKELTTVIMRHWNTLSRAMAPWLLLMLSRSRTRSQAHGTKLTSMGIAESSFPLPTLLAMPRYVVLQAFVAQFLILSGSTMFFPSPSTHSLRVLRLWKTHKTLNLLL